MSWSTLPVELTIRILLFFDPKELVNFRKINSFFKSLIDEATTFQYRIALFASGMEDGSPGDLTTSERLDLLRRYEASWKNLKWNEHKTIPSVQGQPVGRSSWDSYGNVLCLFPLRSQREGGTVDFIQLPSHLRSIPMRQWTLRFDFEVQLGELGIDSSQDLLVTVENVENFPTGSTFLVHLRSLSTGEKHPLAGNTAVLEYPLTDLSHWSISVQISGEYVGILFENEYGWGNELVVWSWRRGVRKLVSSPNLGSFAFLGDNFILGSTSKPPALLVYSLQQPERPADSTTHSNTHLLRFLFGNPDIVEISLISDSSPGWSPNAGLQIPFQIAGDTRIITMNLRFPQHHGICETSLIHTMALLRFVENLPIEEAHDVDWGLHGSLLSARIPGRRRWDQKISFTYGMRYALPRAVHLCGKPMVIICDICPRRCLRASKEERQESELLYLMLMSVLHRPNQSYPHSILKSVPLPEDIRCPENARLMTSDDGIVIFEEAPRSDYALHLLAF